MSIYPTPESAKPLLTQSRRQHLHIHQQIKKADLNFQNTGDIEMSVYLSGTGICGQLIPLPSDSCKRLMPIINPSSSVIFNNAICGCCDGILLKPCLLRPCFHVAGHSRPQVRSISICSTLRCFLLGCSIPRSLEANILGDSLYMFGFHPSYDLPRVNFPKSSWT